MPSPKTKVAAALVTSFFGLTILWLACLARSARGSIHVRRPKESAGRRQHSAPGAWDGFSLALNMGCVRDLAREKWKHHEASCLLETSY